MSLPRLLAWLLGALVVIAALVLLLARGFGSPTYDGAARAAILAEWVHVEELARVPPPPPPGTPLADDFGRRLAGPGAPDAAAMQDFAAWLAGPGPHRLAPFDQRTPAADTILALQEACTQLAKQGVPELQPGLLALAHALRTEGHLIDQIVGIQVTEAVLDRLLAEGLALPPGAAALAPTEDELQRTLARDALAMVQLLDGDGLALASSSSDPLSLAAHTPPEVLALALRRAAIESLEPAYTPSAPPSTWDLVSQFLLGDSEALERELASLIRPTAAATQLLHSRLRKRYADALASPTPGDPAHDAAGPEPDAASTDPTPAAAPPQPADLPPGG